MRPETLSWALRSGEHPFLTRRRGIAALSLLSSASMGVIALYQLGITRRIPEPPLPKLDAERVDASAEAYAHLQIPDAYLGLVSYALTAALAAAGEPARAQRRPWLPLALGAKVLLDAAQAARLTRDQWTRHRAFCSWCLLAASATLATVPLAYPEAASALAALRARKR